MVDLLNSGPVDAPATILLAHGAGAAMDSPGMELISAALVAESLAVARFEFGYMAGRRAGKRRPPPRADKIMPEFVAAVDALDAQGPLIIAGKSMGGRVATMVADDLYAAGRIKGTLCLGYPFHPPAKPDQLRTAHLADLQCPTLIVQGTRDPFGTEEEVPGYDLSPSIRLHWMPDGDHDLKPRKRISGFTHTDHITSMAQTVAEWVRSRL